MIYAVVIGIIIPSSHDVSVGSLITYLVRVRIPYGKMWVNCLVDGPYRVWDGFRVQRFVSDAVVPILFVSISEFKSSKHLMHLYVFKQLLGSDEIHVWNVEGSLSTCNCVSNTSFACASTDGNSLLQMLVCSRDLINLCVWGNVNIQWSQ